jgi:hypothetical protein
MGLELCGIVEGHCQVGAEPNAYPVPTYLEGLTFNLDAPPGFHPHLYGPWPARSACPGA